MAEKNKNDGRAFEVKRAAQDDDDRRKHATDRLSASGSSSAAEFDFLPGHLRRKYYVVEVDATEARIYADRDGEYLIAKAGRDRLVTLVANIEIVRDLVAIAAHRGWERIELTGSLEFRREAWLAASARGIETKGYEPSDLDRAALAKAGRDRLVTLVANIEIVRDLVAIAAHRGWERIELTGSLEFRREAWLAASTRGIETKGYEPSELDRAAFAKMQGRSEHDQSHSFGRDRSGARAPARRSSSTERGLNGGEDDRNARSHLALIERIAFAAFPKDAEARKRILDAARERMVHHRHRGARFERAQVVEGKSRRSRESAEKSVRRTAGADQTERAYRNR